MRVKIKEVIESEPFQSRYGDMISWYLATEDGQMLKINSKPKNKYQAGDEVDVLLTGGDPWEKDGLIFETAKRDNAPQGQQSAPHPADTPPGYKPAARQPDPLAEISDADRVPVSKELRVWVEDIMAISREYELGLTGADIMENARAVAIHMRITRERR